MSIGAKVADAIRNRLLEIAQTLKDRGLAHNNINLHTILYKKIPNNEIPLLYLGNFGSAGFIKDGNTYTNQFQIDAILLFLYYFREPIKYRQPAAEIIYNLPIYKPFFDKYTDFNLDIWKSQELSGINGASAKAANITRAAQVVEEKESKDKNELTPEEKQIIAYQADEQLLQEANLKDILIEEARHAKKQTMISSNFLKNTKKG